jgi:hypothetical protein
MVWLYINIEKISSLFTRHKPLNVIEIQILQLDQAKNQTISFKATINEFDLHFPSCFVSHFIVLMMYTWNKFWWFWIANRIEDSNDNVRQRWRFLLACCFKIYIRWRALKYSCDVIIRGIHNDSITSQQPISLS